MTYGVPYDIIITGGEIAMGKKNKRKKKQKRTERIISLTVKALVGIGAFMTGLASLINSLR